MDSLKVTAVERKYTEWKYGSVDAIPNERDKQLMKSAEGVLSQSTNGRLAVAAGLRGNDGREKFGTNTPDLHAEVNTLFDYFAECIADGVKPDIQTVAVCADSNSPTDPDVCGKCLSLISRFVTNQKTSYDDIQVLVRKKDGSVYQQSLWSLHPKPFVPLQVEIDDIMNRVSEKVHQRGGVMVSQSLTQEQQKQIDELRSKLEQK